MKQKANQEKNNTTQPLKEGSLAIVTFEEHDEALLYE
jgi:hypothetical protein